jgi:hypothetical protein
MAFSFGVSGLDGVMDDPVEVIWVGEGPMREMTGLKVASDDFDVIAFGGVLGQPLDDQPIGPLGKRRRSIVRRCYRRLAGHAPPPETHRKTQSRPTNVGQPTPICLARFQEKWRR